MKKVIHLSDLHLGFPKLEARCDQIFRAINHLKQPANNYVIVITGDLVDSAFTIDDYEKAVVRIDGLRSAGFEVLVCPGNHDYGSGSYAKKKMVPLFKKAFFGDTSIIYPKLDIIDTCAFIGLDTMAEELDGLDGIGANGEIGKKQLQRLDNILGSAAVQAAARRVVYFHHHPIDGRILHGLKDSDGLRKAVAGRVDALLYGHNHEGKIHNGHWQISRCYDAGTTTSKEGKAHPDRIIDFDRDPRFDYDADFSWTP